VGGVLATTTTGSPLVLNVVQSVVYIGVRTNKTKMMTNFICITHIEKSLN
jgi:hypothetical protein